MLTDLLNKHLKVDINKMRKTNFLESQREFELKMISNVNNKNGWKEISVCPLCNFGKYVKEFDKYGIPLVKCEKCELRFQVKIPGDSNAVYQDDNYTVYTKEDSCEHYEYRKERFGRERVQLLERHCGRLAKKKILDVGCGNGYFLSVAKEAGAFCFGSEFSEKLRKFTLKEVVVPVYRESLDNFPEKDFDIITIFDVLEHIESPVSFMSAAAALLKEGGYIIVYTPNFDSFSIKVMKEYSSIIAPAEHLVLFSYEPAKYLGDITGLKVIHMETRGLDIHSILACQDYRGEARNEFLVKWVDELQAMIDVSGAADYMRVIYRKGC